jgi:hypothetical protein
MKRLDLTSQARHLLVLVPTPVPGSTFIGNISTTTCRRRCGCSFATSSAAKRAGRGTRQAGQAGLNNLVRSTS